MESLPVPSYETRRADLAPEVREYADRLRAELLGVSAKYGADSLNDLYAKLASGEIRIPKKESEGISRKVETLAAVLDTKERPPSHSELPPLEVFEECIARIEKQTGEKVKGLAEWDQYELIGGKLNGMVYNGDRFLPVINGGIVTEIRGEVIEGCSDVRNVDGKLNGAVKVGGLWLPVINGELVAEIQGRKIKGCDSVRNVDGELNGAVYNGFHMLPVINGELVAEIQGRKIEGCAYVRNVGGKLNGKVEVGGRWLPVINGELVAEIQGMEIEDCCDVRNVGGKLNGRFKAGGGSHMVVLGKIVG